ncbi:MAG: DUF456 domain-containing protein [Planctomycetes bacterium]|nr:DUF456 domain-containing protein [Planctomycetota bacterium]
MELTFIILVGLLFTVAGLVCVATVVVGLPGAWMLIALAVVIEVIDGLWLSADGGQQTFEWWLLITCLGLAAVGEGLEFAAGALGAKKAGSSRRGMIGALVGGVLGALAGVAIPIPIFGSLIGAVVGTFVGAILGEMGAPEPPTMRDSLKPATGATIGRILGTLSKLPIAVAIWCALSVAAFWP